MHDTVWAHTHACVRMNPPIESKWLVQRHIMNRSRYVWGASVRFLTHVPHQRCVFKHACTHHLHTYACSGCLRTIHSLAWLSATSLYIRGPAWTSMITLTNNKIGYHGGFFIWFVYRSIGHGEIQTLSLSAYTMHTCMHESPSLAWSVV